MNNRAIGLAVGLCTAMVLAGHAGAAEKKARATKAPPPVVEQRVPTNKEELNAVETARAALARAFYVQPDTLPVLSIEPRSWANTGLGCATPDTATINITRRGYVIVLATPVGARDVHVSGRSARICDPVSQTAATPILDDANASPPPYDLNAMVERSRTDLAHKLKTPVRTVRLVSFSRATWPDSTMACVVPYEQIRKKSVKGYRILLWHHDRMYTYHTDLVRTRACPEGEKADPATARNDEAVDKSTRRAGRESTKSSSDNSAYYGVIPLHPSP